MTKTLLKGLGTAGDMWPAARYLASFDVEGGDAGIGWTPHQADAMRFDNLASAMSVWRQKSTTQPLRDNGRPNRPLSAYTVTFQQVDQ